MSFQPPILPPDQEEVSERDIRIGDVIVGWTASDGDYSRTPEKTVSGFQGSEVMVNDGGTDWRFHTMGSMGVGGRQIVKTWRIKRRAGLQSGCAISMEKWDVKIPYQPPAKKVIGDWPETCPRCRRPQSAYLGLNQYDCKHGCYKS